MIRFACIVAFALSAGAASAQSVKLTGKEISILLSGNTAVGDWEGTPYRQYFDPEGVTVFAQPNVRSVRGAWRIDEVAVEYQSIWSGDAEWEGWYVMEFGGDWFWVSKSTPPTPFEVLEGNQLIE